MQVVNTPNRSLESRINDETGKIKDMTLFYFEYWANSTVKLARKNLIQTLHFQSKIGFSYSARKLV